ncbi:MAG: hypothetical protein K0S32_2428 [Bacteroidetes bacterium]|jgi:hypothetical protein|nr:hypothetical protein [Bacteroidota bacterium]
MIIEKLMVNNGMRLVTHVTLSEVEGTNTRTP